MRKSLLHGLLLATGLVMTGSSGLANAQAVPAGQAVPLPSDTIIAAGT